MRQIIYNRVLVGKSYLRKWLRVGLQNKAQNSGKYYLLESYSESRFGGNNIWNYTLIL